MKRVCLLCSREIFPNEPYHYFGNDLDPGAIRAHDIHIDLEPYRWIELGRQLGESLPGVVVTS